ncbi:MAG: glutathione peroxidase [Bacteroidetes bacterium]|nr:glutathione peroxidase [Bacteroidota bacterium]
MTNRQKILKAIYPAFVWITKLTGKNTAELSNTKQIPPKTSVYDLSVQLNNSTLLRLDSLKGKKILFVNTASDCGYTAQYDDLQKLYGQFKDKLIIIGFPANDFKEQEKGTDEEIASFCKLNFGVTFPLAKKSVVIKGPQQNEIFQWLTDAAKNGWNDKAPVWNFSKFLVNEQGVLVNYFEPSVSPLSNDVTAAINK